MSAVVSHRDASTMKLLIVLVCASVTLVSGSPLTRAPRSIWPFSWFFSSTEEPEVIPPSETFSTDSFMIDPRDNRVYRIHRFQGVDVTPVEDVPANELYQFPQGQPAARDHQPEGVNHLNQNAVSINSLQQGEGQLEDPEERVQEVPSEPEVTTVLVDTGSDEVSPVEELSNPSQELEEVTTTSEAPTSEIPTSEAPTEPTVTEENRKFQPEENPDLSFLDDLGGLIYFLPELSEEEEKKFQEQISKSQQSSGFLNTLMTKMGFGGEPVSNQSEISGGYRSPETHRSSGDATVRGSGQPEVPRGGKTQMTSRRQPELENQHAILEDVRMNMQTQNGERRAELATSYSRVRDMSSG